MAMGGVGEAMLLGAAMGGGAAAVTGGDPLKGALTGGLSGGIGGGIGALGAAGATAGTAAGTAGTAAAVPAVTAAAVPAVTELGTAAALNAVPATTSLTSAAAQPSLAPNFMGQYPSYPPVTPAFTPNGLGPPPSGIAGLPANVNASAVAPAPIPKTSGTFVEGMQRFANDPMESLSKNKFTGISAAIQGALSGKPEPKKPEEYNGPLKRYKFNPDSYESSFYAAEGGITNLAGGYDRIVGEEPMYSSNMASGGISNLGSYSDYAQGGRMLKGPGDGMSDSIPASIAGKRPARLAEGEFVVPADVVSHLGNGSTDAGAKQLYAMMNKVRQARTGRKAQGREINPRQYVPA